MAEEHRDDAVSRDERDVAEQRQRPDGTREGASTIDTGAASSRYAAVDAPRSPDEYEQRQRADGTFDGRGLFDEVGGAPPSADVIEQWQEVEHDDEDAPR